MEVKIDEKSIKWKLGALRAASGVAGQFQDARWSYIVTFFTVFGRRLGDFGVLCGPFRNQGRAKKHPDELSTGTFERWDVHF